ncbi:hypothetical protein RQP46_009827 [Phenoliferia psychrophenolica]
MATFLDLPVDAVGRIVGWAGASDNLPTLCILARVSKALAIHANRVLYSVGRLDPGRPNSPRILSTGPWGRHSLTYLGLLSEEGMYDRGDTDRSAGVLDVLDVIGDKLKELEIGSVRNLDWNVFRHPNLAGLVTLSLTDPDPGSKPLTLEPLPLRLASLTVRCMWGNHSLAQRNFLALFEASAETLTTLRIRTMRSPFQSIQRLKPKPKSKCSKPARDQHRHFIQSEYLSLERLLEPGFALVAPNLRHLEFHLDPPPPKVLAVVACCTSLESLYAPYKTLSLLFAILPPQLSRLVLGYDAVHQLHDLRTNLDRLNLSNIKILDFQVKRHSSKYSGWESATGSGGPQFLAFCEQRGIMVRFQGDFASCD